MVIFVLLQSVLSIYPSILVVFAFLNPYIHLSCHHLCNSWTSTIHLSIHFHCLCIFPSLSQSFKWLFLYFSSRCDPYIYPFLPSLNFPIHISIFRATIFVHLQLAPSIYPPIFTGFCAFPSVFRSFKRLFLYFSSQCNPYIHPFLSTFHFSTHIPIFHVTIFVLLQPTPSSYPTIFIVFVLFHPYFNHLHVPLCSFPPLYPTFSPPLHFTNHMVIFHAVILVFLPPTPSIYPSIFIDLALFYLYFSLLNGCFCTFLVGTILISAHSCRLYTSPSIFPSFMWPYLYFSDRHHPSTRPFSPFFHFSIRISVFQLVLFVLLQPVRSIYLSILAVCGRLHRYTHLSCDHISTFPAGAIRLSIHFHHLGIFYSYFSLSMVIFILLQSVRSIYPSFMWPSLCFSSQRYPSIHPFSPSLHFYTRISVFKCLFLYFCSQCDPYIHPFLSSLHFSIHISHLWCGHVCTFPTDTIHLSIHSHLLCNFPSIFW